jgi:hypothetical protein
LEVNAMGIMKRIQLEEAEREYAEHLRKLKEEADAEFPGEDWDPEVYEDYRRVMDKDD